MNSSILNPQPNGTPPTLHHSITGKALQPQAPRAFTWIALLAGLMFLLFSAPAVLAHQSPPGCTGSGLGILLFTDSPDVHIGDTLNYSVTIFNGTGVGPVVCDATSIQASLVTPDGINHVLTLLRTDLSNGQSDYYSNVVSYVVRAQDVRTDGTVRATASDTGFIHQNDTDSQGGGNQGVNTEVSLPCIGLLVQCAGGVGENGAITYTGTVTNCGNNTLVGVTVTNFVNGGQFQVTFITNLLAGQIASFSGSWVPANPCNPSTATLSAQGIDRFTTHPRTVTSAVDTTCSVVLTPGIKVTKACPGTPVSPGQALVFSGSVSNTGNVTLTNIVVVDNQPVANTIVFAAASLAPGAVTNFTGSYPAPTNCSVSDTLLATASSRCGVPVSDTASVICPILTTPAITVTEVCPLTPGVSGGSSSYSGIVRNSGDITLNNVIVLSDRPVPNTVVFTAASLAPGASAVYSGNFTVPLNVCTVTTTVRARGSDACTSAGVTNTATATCPITTAPAIAVTLLCPTTISINGAPITYTGTVQNSGNVTLDNVVVTDSQSTPPTVLTIPSLAPGASANFTASFVAPLDVCSVSSTVSASGSDHCSQVLVSNSASATCPLGTNPRIVVTQNCSGGVVAPGGLLTYSGSVSNAGNISLTNIVVLNDQTGATPVFTAVSLAPHASTNFTGSYTVPANAGCAVTSTLIASSRDSCSGTLVTSAGASATCSITGTPLLAVTLNCPATPVVSGNSITFSGTVRNPGNVTLSNVTVIDLQASPSTVLTLASLAPGASANFTASFTSPANACTVTSSVTARGTNSCAGVVSTDTASATCTLLTTAAIVVRENCPTTPATAGGVLTFSGSVSNAGNITLSNIVVVNDHQAPNTTSNTSSSASFGTINPPLVPPTGSVAQRFTIGDGYTGLTFAAPDEGYAANQFYSMRREASGSSTFVTINANGTVTGRFDAGNKNFDALTFAAPDVGYGPVIFYYLSHDNAGVSSFGTIKPGGAVGVVADLFPVGNNFDALTFSATDVGYGANLFYYLRHDINGSSTLGTINPALPGTVTDRFPVGTNVDALVFTATDVGYGANLFYYLRHDGDGRSTFGTISAVGAVTDRFVVGTNFNELAFATTDVGFAANLFYYLGSGGNTTTTNTQPPVFTVASLAPGASTNFTGSFTVPSSNTCSVTTITTVTASDLCSGNMITNSVTTICPLLTAPAIAVTLVCPDAIASPGGVITYTGTVRNSGNVTLNDVTVVDTQASPPLVLSLASLAPGVSSSFIASFAAPLNACAVSSTVVAFGTDACSAARVTNSASATCPLGTAPSITITENCSTTPVGPGGVLSFSGTVRNTGNITLTNVIVLSDRTGATPILIIPTLAANASSNYTGSYRVPADNACSITTVVAVTGRDTCSGIAAANTASITCPIIGNPRIEVTQTCPLVQVIPGGILTYSGIVSNAGNITLNNIVVSSDRTNGTVVLTLASLAPGATAPFTGSYRTREDCCSDSSTVTATGRDCNNTVVSDTSTRTCTLLTQPAIALTTVCSPQPWGPPVPGQTMNYSGIVSNSGNITLTNVTIVDSAPTNGTRVYGPIILAAGETASFTASFVVPADFCGTHTTTARGLDACTLSPVTATSTTTCPVTVTPQIAVTMNCPPQATPKKGTFTFTGTVSNPGNVTLTNVFVTNDQPSNNTPVIGPITLAPGASTNFSGSYLVPCSDCCEVTDTLTAHGEDRCGGTLVADTTTQICPLLTTPRLVVIENCPATPVAVGGVFEFTGFVTNAGDVVLRDVYVVSSQPAANTPVLGPIELAPGESEEFSGSYTVVAGGSGLLVSASATDVCQSRPVTAAANCSGPIIPPVQANAITVAITGNGTVSGVVNGQLLTIGHSYTATATPAAGSFFTNWSGGVSGTSPSLTFVMRSNLVIIANFLPNGGGTNGGGTNGGSVFKPVAGVFNGLFFDTNDVQTGSSGSFSLTMKAVGAYTATVKHKGKSYTVKGTFAANGTAVNNIPRPGTSPLTVNWQGNLEDSDYLSGSVGDGTFLAQLSGGRNVFSTANHAPQAGKYTLIIPGILDATDSPAGNGYGTIALSTSGLVQFSGRLADGTVVVQKVGITKTGEWPLSVPLYAGKGLLIGWLQFGDDGVNDVAGTLQWMKPNLPTSVLYKSGFSVTPGAIGSHYLAPVSPNNLLDITDGLVLLSGGNLPDSVNQVRMGPSSKLVNQGPNTLKLTFTPASGLFSGSFREAGATKSYAIKGVVLQRQNNGSGYAPGADQSGKVVFDAVP